MTTKELQGILHKESERKQTMKGQSVQNHRRGKDKKEDSNTDYAAHTQTLKQQKQLNDRNQSPHTYQY
jgi:hypothetical protein